MVFIAMPTNEQRDALLLPAGLLVLSYGAWRVLFASPAPYRIEQEPSSTNDGQSHARKVPLHRPASTLWLLGNTLDVTKYHKDRYHDWLKEESERAGWKPWLLSMLGKRPAIVLSTPEAFDDVLQKQPDVFEKGPARHELIRDFLGDGIGAADGELWRLQRKRTAHLFLAPTVLPFMAEVVHRHTRELCAVVDALMAEQRSFSLKHLFCSLTTDIFGEIGFGVDLGSLAAFGSPGATHPFLSAHVEVGKMLQARTQQPYWLWKLKRRLGVGVEKTGRRSLNVMHGIVNDVILKGMARVHGPERKDFLSVFLAQEQEKQQKLDTTVVRDMMLSIYIAGQNPPASAMGWFIVMMNRHPDVAAKIRDEIADKLPSLAQANLAGAAASDVPVPTLEDVQSLTYLEACLRESMRLNGPALNTREAKKDTVLSDGTFVPRGTTVLLALYAMQHSQSIWGSDVDEFKPERWIDAATNKLRNVPPCQFLPFLVGPHICPGRKFAMMEMKMILAVLISRYDLKTVQHPEDVNYAVTFSFAVKGDLPVQVARPARAA